MSANPTTDNWSAVAARSKAALTPEIVAQIETAHQGPHPAGALIAVLHAVQEHFGYLPRAQMDAVAQLLGVPTATVTGVATFYHYFRLQPAGRFRINVCMGTACYVKGADKVAGRFEEELGIDYGQTTTDGQYSLHSAACLGTCGLAPVVMINDQVYSKVTADQVPALLEKTQNAEPTR
jgi:NADH-quinone oxidoreductase E subunit